MLSAGLALRQSTGSGKRAGLASSHGIRDSISVSTTAWKLIGTVELAVGFVAVSRLPR